MGSSDVEDVDASKGIYAVCGQLWSVGCRYKLQEHVGSGSYGDVCRAVDLEFSQVVALKRVPDIFFCQMLAKRVLREVCIMRRLIHPYIISLTDVFTSKNLEKPDSTDLYIATEFAERGDMYHQREPMTAETIRTLIWQLLVSVNFMHSCHVWHRDIKSENVLLTGNLQAKLCDFGLSRSALETSSYMDAKPTTGRKKKPVLTRQYTKTVVTPSHRAPEVVMSQGQYTSAIDLWSVGCIFWELLVRESHPNHRGPLTKPLFGVRGEPTTPLRGESYNSDISSELHEQLDVIFNVIGTPCWKDIESVPGEHWRAYLKKVPGRVFVNRMRRPKSGRWMTFQITVEMKNAPTDPKIRSFLAKYLGDRSRPFRVKSCLKLRKNWTFYRAAQGAVSDAGNIVKRLSGLVDDNALDLLQRMLTFAPQRRCTADEALNHTYFKGMNKALDVWPIPGVGRSPSALPDHPLWKISEPAVALGLLERELEMSANHDDGGKMELEHLLQCEVEQQQMQTNLRRASLRSFANNGLFNRSVLPSSAVLKPPREIPLFRCATSRATDNSFESMSNQSESWSVEERLYQTQGEPARGSNDSEISQELGQPTGIASALEGSLPYISASVQEDEPPPAKRPRKMMIRQGSLRFELNCPDIEPIFQQGERIGDTKLSNSGSRARKGKG